MEMGIGIKIWSKFLLVFILLLPLTKAFGQIGTNPGDPNGVNSQGFPGTPGTNNAFQSNTKSKVKGDSGVVKKIFYSKSVRRISEKDLTDDSLVFHKIDTSIDGKERYSPLYPYNDYRINLGALGLPQKQLIPEFGEPIGFNNGQQVLSIYLLQPEDLYYYRSKSPYTQLAYMTAKKTEQWFSLIHVQNINPRLNIGLQYYREGSQGFYQGQVVDNLNLAFFAWYQSKNYRYNLISSLVFNSLNAQINGGILGDSVFTAVNHTQHIYLNGILNGAQTTWNQFDYYLKQVYNIGHIDSIKDKKFRAMEILPLIQAKYTLHFKKSSYNYSDPLLGSPDFNYYPNIFLDSTITNDIIQQNTLENEFGLALFGHGNLKKEGSFKISGAHLDASIKDQNVHYQQNGKIDSNLNNIILHSNGSYNLSDRLNVEINGDYNLIGSNHGDYLLKANASLNFGDLGALRGLASIQSNQPDFIYDHYSSNSYRWDFRFSKVKIEKLIGAYENSLLHFKISAEINLINGFTYFAGAANQIVFPSQFSNQIRIVRFKVEKTFNFHHFGLQLYGLYQQNNEPLIVRSPKTYAFGSLYYQNTLVKVLRLRLGFESFFYGNSYYYDYAPGLQQFFTYTNSQYGNYPVVNAFLVAGLKRVKLTLKYDYINQGLPKGGYYTIHNYPASDGVLKFGVSWNFYD